MPLDPPVHNRGCVGLIRGALLCFFPVSQSRAVNVVDTSLPTTQGMWLSRACSQKAHLHRRRRSGRYVQPRRDRILFREVESLHHVPAVGPDLRITLLWWSLDTAGSRAVFRRLSGLPSQTFCGWQHDVFLVFPSGTRQDIPSIACLVGGTSAQRMGRTSCAAFSSQRRRQLELGAVGHQQRHFVFCLKSRRQDLTHLPIAIGERIVCRGGETRTANQFRVQRE